MQTKKEMGKGQEGILMGTEAIIKEPANWNPHWTIKKYDVNGNLSDVLEFNGNCLLNEGITEMLSLISGIGGTAFSSANACIGIGESSVAAEAAQTGLQGTSITYKPMDPGYPQVSGQSITYQAAFGPDDANYEWQESTIANGNSDTAQNMNRKVQDMGRKAAGTTWIARCSIALS